MNINPYILLGIGSLFALAYAMLIIFGWQRTRRNRRILRSAYGISRLQEWDIASWSARDAWCDTISLENNYFEDTDGKIVNPADYDVYIAVGTSEEYPTILAGDILMLDKKRGAVKYVFTAPDVRNFR